MRIKLLLSGILFLVVSSVSFAAQKGDISKESDDQRAERRSAMTAFRDEVEKRDGDKAFANIRFGMSVEEYQEQLSQLYKWLEGKDIKSKTRDCAFVKIPVIHRHVSKDSIKIMRMGEDGDMQVIRAIKDRYRFAHSMPFGRERMERLDDRRRGASFYKDSLFSITMVADCGVLQCKDLVGDTPKTYEEKFGAFNQKVNNTIRSLYLLVKEKYGEADDDLFTEEPFTYREWEIPDNTERAPENDRMYCYIEWDMARRNIQILVRDSRCSVINGTEVNCAEGCDWYSSVNVFLSITDKHIVNRIRDAVDKEQE